MYLPPGKNARAAPVSVRADHVEAVPSLVLGAHSKGNDRGCVAREVVSAALLEALPGLALRQLLKAGSIQSPAGFLCKYDTSNHHRSFRLAYCIDLELKR